MKIRCLLPMAAVVVWLPGLSTTVASTHSNKVVGAASCVECHKKEGRVWENTSHYQGYFDLHRQPKARDIARRLEVRRIRADNRCASCHYTGQVREGTLEIVSGVSCESCHGPAEDWMPLHNEYVGGASRRSESAEQKMERITRASRHGFRSPQLLYDLASRCYQCHAVADEQLVNQGGHATGQDFELLTWTQGEIRHNFCSSEDEATNAEASPARKRILYVLGRILDLEHGYRTLARATTKADYAVASARRIRDARRHLETIHEIVPVKEIEQILAVAREIPLKLQPPEGLISAADRTAGLARILLLAHDGSQWAGLDPLLPDPSRYRGGPPVERAR